MIATQSVHPRAMEAARLVELAHRFGRPGQVILPVEAALQAALKQAAQEEAVV